MGLVNYQAEITSDVIGTLNPAFTDICMDDTTGTPAQLAARVIGWIQACQWASGPGDSRIVSMRLRNLPAVPYFPQAFPATEYASVVTAFNTFAATTVLTPMTAYGDILNPAGTATSSGRGDSICFNTRASVAGRHGRGRNFIPYLTKNIIASDGLLNPVASATLERWYRALFLGVGITALPTVGPHVWSPSTGFGYPIDIVSTNRIPSRLRSRTK
jgi:hypothetical protein